MIPRVAEVTLAARLESFAVTALLGPRQVGKTTLARDLAKTWPSGAVYLDLERPADLRRLDDADAFLRAQFPRLVVLDEVHRMPEIFPVLRGIVDDNRRAGFRTGQFLLLGSAALDLVQMSSESLAGRISHLDLAGINLDEAAASDLSEDAVWVRGGFPDSLTAANEVTSATWRRDLIRSYLERDVPMFAPRVPTETLRRLWTMLAHSSGSLFNATRLAENLAISGPTVARYVDLLVDLGLIRRLEPWSANTGKRVTKSPKIHVRDTGLLHSLLDITDLNDLLGHPVVGASYESFAVECLVDSADEAYRPYHFRTARGDEIDLVLVRGGRPEIAVEVKRSTAPVVSAGFHRACADLSITHRFVVHPTPSSGPDDSTGYRTRDGVHVLGLTQMVRRLRADDPSSPVDATR